MSVLSKNAIINRIRAGDLVVSPILSDQQLNGGSSIDLRMGTVILMVRARGLSHVDPTLYRKDTPTEKLSREIGKRQKHERHEAPYKEQFLLHPGTLALVPTLEWVKLPLNLQGVVTARSSWAREGLSIATATLINPGYQGIITLELANLGQIPIGLYPGLRIAQIAFYEIRDPGVLAPSKSQFQMAFEPEEGEIVAGDEKFVRLHSPSSTARS